MAVGIVDYGMGNLRSVSQALDHVGASWRFVHTAAELDDCSHVILPGVGAFRDAIGEVHRKELVDPLRAFMASGRPFLGVCLGMQLLLDRSYEHGEHEGLGVIRGEVRRFAFQGDQARVLKIPHMGWNDLHWSRPSPLLAGLEPGVFVYFVHSYYCAPADDAVVQTTTDYGGPFCSMLQQANIYACQFHPEKSQRVGLRMYDNFVRLEA